MKRPIVLLSVGAILAAPCLLWPTTGRAAVYHVDQHRGSDADRGTAARPFATISACARVALPGDVCRVHSGTYRETVSVAASGREGAPIRFEVAPGECATVSGAERVTAPFRREGGSIWVAAMTDPVEQLFSHGEMIWEGQWPNRTRGLLFEPPRATAAQGTGVQGVGDASVSTVVDPNIPDADWTGAMIYIMPGSRWQSDSRPIRAYDRDTHTLTLDTTTPWAEASIRPMPTNEYYLYDSKLTLDVQDEWFWQGGRLHYYSSDDPGRHALEYKKRSFAFDVAGSYVEISGFRVFASAVRLNGHHDTVDSVVTEYSSHLRSFNAYYTEGDVNIILGDDNVWKNSEISKSGSAGLIIRGDRNVIVNNVVSDVTYQATNHAGIEIPDWSSPHGENQILFNTVTRSGRSGIYLYGAQESRVLYNKVTEYALLTNDMGGIYAWGTDGQNTEIAYNEVGHNRAFWGNGIYLDDNTRHFVVHHNYVHDSDYFGFTIKNENHFFNNTLSRVGAPFLIDKNFQLDQWQNTSLARVQNNLTDGAFLVRFGVLPSIVEDYGYFETPIRVTPEWRRHSIRFSSLKQAGWSIQKPFDLTSVAAIDFTPWVNGAFELELDDIRLEGPSARMLDDFESGDQNALGGARFAGGSGDGVASTGMAMTLVEGGSTPRSRRHARIDGVMVQGWDAAANISWGEVNEYLPGSDLSGYTGISFDVRGRMKDFRVLAIGGNGPMQSHNAAGPFSEYALDKGVAIPGITDAFRGAAPDIGAFELGSPVVAPGAVRAPHAGPDHCGCKVVPDLPLTLPPRAPRPW